MFALPTNQGRARGGLTPRVSSSSRISGQKPNLLFHNQIFSNTSLSSAHARVPPARPSSRRQIEERGVGGVPQKFSHENGDGEGQHRLHLPKLLGTTGRKTLKPAESSICLSDHCQAIKLPEVKHHMPKIKTPPGASDKNATRDKIKRSKYLKKKILGSSDANVLPNRPMIVPKRVQNENYDKNTNKLDSKSSRFSQQSAPPASPRPLSPVARASVLKHRALALNRAKALSAGQVHVRPKIDKEVLVKLQSKCKQPLEKDEIQATRRTGSGTSVRNVYSQMQLERGLNPSCIPHGGPMIMESRSMNRIILKPEVPRGLQVVRRKSKFMQNQNLQDIFSIQGKNNVQQNPNFQFNRLHRGIRGDGNFEYASASFERLGPKWQQKHYQHHLNGHLSSDNCIDKIRVRQVPRRFQSELKK